MPKPKDGGRIYDRITSTAAVLGIAISAFGLFQAGKDSKAASDNYRIAAENYALDTQPILSIIQVPKIGAGLDYGRLLNCTSSKLGSEWTGRCDNNSSSTNKAASTSVVQVKNVGRFPASNVGLQLQFWSPLHPKNALTIVPIDIVASGETIYFEVSNSSSTDITFRGTGVSQMQQASYVAFGTATPVPITIKVFSGHNLELSASQTKGR